MLGEDERQFVERAGLILALDHSGRGGNGFFLTLFDQHPEVLTCPWIHYVYSYLLSTFDGAESVDSAVALETWPKKSYLRFAYSDLTPEIAGVLRKMGGEASPAYDRKAVRDTFARLVGLKPRVSRRELVLYTYMAFARGAGRSLAGIRFLMVSDAPSLRTESPLTGFSARIIPAIHADFPGARIVSLERDPRATFASCRHQFVNANGNMYGYRPGNALVKLGRLARAELDPSDCAYLYWILYFAASARAAFAVQASAPDTSMFVRNEDLNLDFLPTMSRICAWLGVGEAPEWRKPGYVPTMVGYPWRGTGAYNSRYQQQRHGRLRNDSDEVAATVTGPNPYVTQRWRTRLAPREIRILEYLFREEMEYFGYPPYPPGKAPRRAAGIALEMLCPFLGELPTPGWIASGAHTGIREVFHRLFYALTFPPFYLVSRFILLRLAFSRGFFGLHGAGSGRK